MRVGRKECHIASVTPRASITRVRCDFSLTFRAPGPRSSFNPSYHSGIQCFRLHAGSELEYNGKAFEIHISATLEPESNRDLFTCSRFTTVQLFFFLAPLALTTAIMSNEKDAGVGITGLHG